MLRLHLTDAETIGRAFKHVCDLEDLVAEARDYARNRARGWNGGGHAMTKPAFSDTELIKIALDGVAGLEEPVTAIRDYASTLLFVACCRDMVSRELSSVLSRLSRDIQDAREQIEEERGNMCRLLHSHRHARQHDDRDNHDDDGNGPIEPAAGDAA